jgi:hypothetical protein
MQFTTFSICHLELLSFEEDMLLFFFFKFLVFLPWNLYIWKLKSLIQSFTWNILSVYAEQCSGHEGVLLLTTALGAWFSSQAFATCSWHYSEKEA